MKTYYKHNSIQIIFTLYVLAHSFVSTAGCWSSLLHHQFRGCKFSLSLLHHFSGLSCKIPLLVSTLTPPLPDNNLKSHIFYAKSPLPLGFFVCLIRVTSSNFLHDGATPISLSCITISTMTRITIIYLFHLTPRSILSCWSAI